MKSDAELYSISRACLETIRFSGIAQVVHHLLSVAQVPGEIVEFGSWRGATAALLCAMSGKGVWIFDSFKGLPEPSPKDMERSEFKRGVFAYHEGLVRETFHEYGLPQPVICAKFFNKVVPKDMPEKIAFAHLDGDLYESIRDSLRLVYPRLSDGGVCLIHDYYFERLPGARIAVDEFMDDKPEVLEKMPESNYVAFRKVPYGQSPQFGRILPP